MKKFMTIIRYANLTEEAAQQLITPENVYEIIYKKDKTIIQKLPLIRSPYLRKLNNSLLANCVVDVYDIDPSILNNLSLTPFIEEIDADEIIRNNSNKQEQEQKDIYSFFEFVPYNSVNDDTIRRRARKYLRPVVMLQKDEQDNTVRIIPSPYVKRNNLTVDGKICYYPLREDYNPSLFDNLPIVRLVEVDGKLVFEEDLNVYLEQKNNAEQEIPVKQMMEIIKFDYLTDKQKEIVVSSENVYEVGYRKGKKLIQKLPLRKSPYLVKPKPYDSCNYVVDVSTIDPEIIDELNLASLIREIDADEIIGNMHKENKNTEKGLYNFYEFIPYSYFDLDKNGEVVTVTLSEKKLPGEVKAYLKPIVMLVEGSNNTLNVIPAPYVKSGNLIADSKYCYYPLSKIYDESLLSQFPIVRAVEIDGKLVFESNLSDYLEQKQNPDKGRQKRFQPKKSQ